MCAQLQEAEFAARPGLRQCQHDEGSGIPMGPESSSFIPRHYGADNTQGKADGAKNECVQHGTIGPEARREVAACDAVDSAIDRCKQESPFEAGHGLAPWWEDTDCVQQDIGSKGEYDAREHARKHCGNTPTNASRWVRLAHEGHAPF